ncbi:hypothetical protein B10263_17590 [Campylobacter jejuni]|uniref:hypothetical protein n=1 Tax=Campylobacter jejuni TaxID=197 RepID=UPI0025814FE3|nr:hypothetical protein [Campylobacter jejuni]EHM1375468.1 hypothetical protein [Campylobacter jejuni]GML43406.1 hypothetical protein B10263_17590 [Campylobacter jejuni]HDV6541714.1 hypothetical protein [Campylobacter jejuni]
MKKNGILSFILGIALVYFGVINIKRILNDSNENKNSKRIKRKTEREREKQYFKTNQEPILKKIGE